MCIFAKMKNKARILIVDDEEALCIGLRTYLELEGYDVETASSAEEALSMDISGFNLLLLDIMMNGISGIELATMLKQDKATSGVPIIFVTAKDSETDMVSGLKLGADDYIAKPYSIKNVLARIEAVLRRVTPQSAQGVTCCRYTLTCCIDGRTVRLPKKEFEILALLTENPGRIFSRDELLEKIWPKQTVVTDRSVDVHIKKQRQKLEPYGEHIITRSGYGYGWQN